MDWTGETVLAKEGKAYTDLKEECEVLHDCGITILIDCDMYRDVRLIKKGFTLVGKIDETDYVINKVDSIPPHISYFEQKYVEYLRRGYDHSSAVQRAKQSETLKLKEQKKLESE